MTNTRMLTARRRKQKAKKDLARIAKQAKKLKKQNLAAAAAKAPQVQPA